MYKIKHLSFHLKMNPSPLEIQGRLFSFVCNEKLVARGFKSGNKFFTLRKTPHINSILIDFEQKEDPFFHMLHQSLHAPIPPQPVPEEKIKSFPQFTISNQQVAEGRQCAVCLEFFQQNQIVTQLPCGDYFHSACIRRWLSEHNSCPYCRRQL